jgi:hypothetical protein
VTDEANPRKWSLPLAQEFAHYGAITGLCKTGEFAAIKYLYDRLSILDSKTSGLLSVNAILVAVDTILVFRSSGSSSPPLNLTESIFSLLGFALLILYLRFDRITEDRTAKGSQGKPISCICVGALIDPSCEYHRALLILADPSNANPPANHCAPRTLLEYKEKFFRTTMRRERAYWWALSLMAASGAITAGLVFGLVVQALFFNATVGTQSSTVIPTPALQGSANIRAPVRQR